MVEVTTDTERREYVTYVRAICTNTRTTPQTIRLESHLDGPIWLPRYHGLDDPAWHENIWEGTVAAGRSRGIGFASPADPVDPPVTLLETRRATDTDTITPAARLCALDDWSPTTDVLHSDP